jgi:hypothetical protein
MKFEIQLFGGPPSGAGSAHTYQSRWAASRDDREVEVVEGAELRVDGTVVGDVVSPVRVR